MKATGDGFLDITGGRLNIDRQVSNVTSTDLDKLRGIAPEHIEESKPPFYARAGLLRNCGLVMLPPNNQFLRFVARNQPLARSLHISSLAGADTDLVMNGTDETIAGTKPSHQW